jgi:hypothetical protein
VPLDPRLLELILCPACRGAIRELSEGRGLECDACGRVYPIRDDIPVLLLDEATPPTRGEGER